MFSDVLKKVPHRQWVFSILKRLRIYYLFDRRSLAKLSVEIDLADPAASSSG
jgi:hypothetical protein